jgi:aquaporin Z
MIAACIAGVLLEHPSSAVHQMIEYPLARHALAGIAMGATAVAIFSSPLGQRSGAHLNPAFTLNFWLLGKVQRWDAVFYAVSQVAGGIAGVVVAAVLIGAPLRHAAVRYVATVPGMHGAWVAFAAEVAISFGLMLAVLTVSNSRRWSRLTPYCAGLLIALWITFESPLSGMSMNPARTAGSAAVSGVWTSFWVYLTAPALGMFAAARAYSGLAGAGRIYCAKIHHHNRKRCIFRCNHAALRADQS